MFDDFCYGGELTVYIIYMLDPPPLHMREYVKLLQSGRLRRQTNSTHLIFLKKLMRGDSLRTILGAITQKDEQLIVPCAY